MSLLGGANLQTAEAKKFKPYIGPVALSLRESGWTTAQIAREIGISPATASMYLWREGGIRLPTAKDLMRRDGIGVPYRPAKPGRGELWEVEKMLRARYRDEWNEALGTAKLSIRERVARHRRERRHMRELRRARQRRNRVLARQWMGYRRSLEREAEREQRAIERAQARAEKGLPKELDAAERWLVRDRAWIWDEARVEARAILAQRRREHRSREGAQKRYRWRDEKPQLFSIDAPLLEGAASWHDYLPGGDHLDPAEILEREEYEDRLASVLGDMEIEDVGRLSEFDLQHLRRRLTDEGLVSISVTEDERAKWRPRDHHRRKRQKWWKEAA